MMSVLPRPLFKGLKRGASFVLASGLLLIQIPAFAGERTTLYDDFGGYAVLSAVISDMLARSLADPEMAPIFANSDMDRLQSMLVLHMCHLADGPCVYDGQHMRRAHDGLGIETRHFNRLVEYMQDAMDEQGVAFRTQNRLLARLAPFHNDVTERSAVPPRNGKPNSHSRAPVGNR
ncbi:hypothetical protein GCM10007854_16680 [Algimonas porphyrae]|uniref:Group 1 truncated hemoglobin n=2 Tax=Algimonas porphyrae TaxID=1128113 RepID=A0ABQ5UZY1_9PROT|nr:hypothetical protein GCM10007854_16680 [Algimonas porphyrae]